MSTKTFASSRKKLFFCPQNDQILPEIGIFGHFGPGLAGSFGALLVGWLVIAARGLYLARHHLLYDFQFVRRDRNTNLR